MLARTTDNSMQWLCGQDEWGPYSSKFGLQFTPCFEDVVLQSVPKLYFSLLA